MAEDNVVFVGNKSPMNYVLAVITQFHNGAKKVDVKARGKAISRAVDTVELLRRAFVKNLEIKHIEIGTEELAINEDNQKSNISSIEITITKAEPKQALKQN